MKNWLSKFIHLKNVVLLIGIVGAFMVTALNLDVIISITGGIIRNYHKAVTITTVLCSAIGTAHAWTKRTEQDNVFFLRFLGSPFIAAIFTAITYGIIINACLALFYIVMYDGDITSKYPVDKYTTVTAIVLLFIASLYGIVKMIWEVCRPPQNEATTGKIE